MVKFTAPQVNKTALLRITATLKLLLSHCILPAHGGKSEKRDADGGSLCQGRQVKTLRPAGYCNRQARFAVDLLQMQ